MIFITLGTQDKPFNRLLEEVDKQIIKGNIKDKVIVQAGCTKYESSNMEIINLIDLETFNEYIKKADLIITHGGVGTILESLKLNKKIIAIPRLSKYNEAVNDHQKQICDEFNSKGYILSDDLENLDKLLINIRNFEPKKYISNNRKFNELLDSFIK